MIFTSQQGLDTLLLCPAVHALMKALREAVGLQAEQLVREAERDGLSGLVQRAAQGLPGFTLCILVEGLDFYLKQRERADFRAAGADLLWAACPCMHQRLPAAS